MNLLGERIHEKRLSKREEREERDKRGEWRFIKWRQMPDEDNDESWKGQQEKKGRTERKQEPDWRWRTVTGLWCLHGKWEWDRWRWKRRRSCGRMRMTSFGNEPVHTNDALIRKVIRARNTYAWQRIWAQVHEHMSLLDNTTRSIMIPKMALLRGGYMWPRAKASTGPTLLSCSESEHQLKL